MPPKPVAVTKQNDTTIKTKSVLVIPSRVVSRPDEFEDGGVGEETEIAAQITVPHEGGWGWVVVFFAFWCIFILDGIVFTFGSIFADMTQDLDISESLVGLLNSIAVSLYFIGSPIASAFINRFGFRACTMTGSVFCAFGLLCTYFTTSYGGLCIFYGVISGIGFCFINLSSGLIVGFYFERLRSIALSIATTGSSIGIMCMFPFNSYLVKIAGWRVLTLLHSGLFGIIFFLGMAFRPLLSLTITKNMDDPTRTVTYLPSLSVVKGEPSRIRANKEGKTSTATERLFSAVSNANFPTAAAVVDEKIIASANQPGPSTAGASRMKITAQTPHSGITQRQLKQVQSIISKASVQDKTGKTTALEINVPVLEPKKRSCWARLCHWEKHVPQARPMYRDDAFYDGNLKNLPAYQKSMMDTSAEPKTGLEYQLAVSRVVTAVDLQERRGVFTTAARRILATMMDPILLKKCSFLLLCFSGFLTYVGFLVPYVFLPDRNSSYGIEPTHCALLVSVIGFSNAIGRLSLGALACKIDPLKIFIYTLVIAGISTALSDISQSLYYQYTYCFIYGFCMASMACLRSLILVGLYGLEKLTNAMGVLLLFQGVGSLLSTPVASMLKTTLGYAVVFYFAGVFITISGLIMIPVKTLANREKNTAE